MEARMIRLGSPDRLRQRLRRVRRSIAKAEGLGYALVIPAVAAFLWACPPSAVAQPPVPQLTGAVNDFANVIDAASEAEIERRINALMAATGDTVVVATVPDIQGYADIDEYRVRMFENGGRGIGQKGTDNGLLIIVAIAERQVGIEVGYDLEGFITDGTAGSIIRERIRPEFRSGHYGAGLLSGATALINRIAQGRGVSLEGVPAAAPATRRRTADGPSCWPFIIMLILFMWIGRGGRRRRRRRGGGGWSSGVGPFGVGFGTGFGGGFGGFGGGGGGGGFGGFGGGGSGGGGASGRW
jgi:uncharacterized protein